MFPREEFALVSTRPFSEEEQGEAREFLASKPRRVLRAWLIGVGLWPLIIGALMMLDVVFGPNDESWLKLLLSLPLMIALLAAPAFGICLGRDIWLEKNLARLAVSGRTLEIWEPRPDFDLCGGPRRVEVVSGTSEVWNIEWDDEEGFGEEGFGEEDEENDDAPDAPS